MSWSRAATRLGLALVLAGVTVLGYVGWQTWGTTWVSQREHAAITDRLEQAWATDPAEPAEPADPADPAVGGGVPEGAVEVDAGVAEAIVEIPRLGAGYRVPMLEGTSDEALAAGIGRFTGSAAPGGVGNLALAGHRVTHGEPLRDMPALEPGDEVVVTTRDAVHTYVLDTGGDDLEVPLTETWVVDPEPVDPDGGDVVPAAGQRRLLTLTTCSELFHTDDRLVAFGHLVSSEPRRAL